MRWFLYYSVGPSQLEKPPSKLNVFSKSELIGRLTSNKCTNVIPMKVYLIFYEINGNKIEIVSFWDNGQDIERRKIK